MIKRILYSELQLHVGRNTKPYRKKYKTQQEEKQNATRKKTKPCRKKNKTMQEEFQNHTRRNAKPFKKKYKAMPEEIQNTEGAPAAAGERDRAAYKSKPPPSYHDSLCTVYSHPPLSSSRS